MSGNRQMLDLRRAQAIVSRTRMFARLFAVLTVAWILPDWLVLEGSELATMVAARMVSAAAFGALALACGSSPPTLKGARAVLAALLLVPVAFFLVSQAVLAPPAQDGWRHAFAASYAFFPMMLAAGIGAFPLCLAEIGAATAILAGAELVALAGDTIAAANGGYEMLWLLLMISAASGYGATSQVKLLAALVDQAVRDPLTDCLRRGSGEEVLALQFALAQRHGSNLALLFADIDHFKNVNDAFGHDAGDRVLAATAEALRQAARETDTLVRWGGEEFVMVLPHTGSREAVALIERLGRSGLGRLPDGKPVTVSIGVAHYPGDAVAGAQELVALSDRRMYLAKQAGRNRFVIDADVQGPVIS